MIRRIQALPKWQRVIFFVCGVVLASGILLALTLAVAWYGVNGTPRTVATALQASVTVREFAVLPDDNAYPSALAVDVDGTLYTGSYVTGTIWRITPDGAVTELPGTREAFGSVTGLTVTRDRTLYVFDRIEPLKPAGASIWRVSPDGIIDKVLWIEPAEHLLPYDLAVDASGGLYATFVVDGGADYVARYSHDGTGGIWWTAPEGATITGITFDSVHNRVLVSDTRQNTIYGLPVDTDTPLAQVVFSYDTRPAPGLDGLVVSPEGEVYVAAPGLNRAARLNVESGELVYLAGGFRGSSRVAYDARRQRLYVNNWDQRSLLPERVLFVEIPVNPHLPFAIDVIEPA